ncbi:hypothetical protein [Cytobacillus firmus]|uniref:hypothetical protein n=1 Tax=Cytobacillus firmus TaxID=1399 RepID=UPI001C988D97|nr:hypothetical protein [Cytobacillus firmus]MBY6052537.1 hypothetical protein [Cytobacillus firmus]
MPFYYEGNVYIRRSETGEKVIFENPAAINGSYRYMKQLLKMYLKQEAYGLLLSKTAGWKLQA